MRAHDNRLHSADVVAAFENQDDADEALLQLRLAGFRDDQIGYFAQHPTRGLLEMGLDSLAAVELRSKLQRELQLSLPATFAFDHGNVELGAEYLFERLRGDRPLDVQTQPAQAAAVQPDDLEAELARLEASLRR